MTNHSYSRPFSVTISIQYWIIHHQLETCEPGNQVVMTGVGLGQPRLACELCRLLEWQINSMFIPSSSGPDTSHAGPSRLVTGAGRFDLGKSNWRQFHWLSMLGAWLPPSCHWRSRGSWPGQARRQYTAGPHRFDRAHLIGWIANWWHSSWGNGCDKSWGCRACEGPCGPLAASIQTCFPPEAA